MSKKYYWLKISGMLLAVVLFFLIVNSFYRENNHLLAERNAWQEKAKNRRKATNSYRTKTKNYSKF